MKTVLITGAGGVSGSLPRAPSSPRAFALCRSTRSLDLNSRASAWISICARLEEIPRLIASLGEVDTLVNNAGVLYCDPFDAIPDAHRREILAVNLEAPSALISALAPQIKARRSGRVVNVASVSAFTGHPDLWYGVSKAGLLNLTKSWARELGPHGGLVNAVAPGPTHTDMYEQLPQSRKDAVMRAVHSGRVCTPEEVAASILWLGSISPEYVNGSTLDVNDGSYPR